MKEDSRSPVLEKLVADGFRPRPEFISDNCVLYVNGDERIIYDKSFDMILKRYEVRRV